MSQHSQSENEDDLSPLEYARRNGLSEDYLATNLGFPELQKLHSELADDADVETNLPDFDFGPELKVEDRLSCSKEAASLLSWVTREESSETIDAIVAPLFKDTNSNSNRKKKLELPLLRTDVDSDCRKFGSRKGFEIKFRDVKLPLEAVAEGEGFDWTKQYENVGTEILQELKAERIGVTRDAMAFLQACVDVSWSEKDDSQLWAREQKYRRATAVDPVTPPLSPLHAPLPQPFEPSSSEPAMQVPILSDPASPTKKDFEALQNEIFEQDNLNDFTFDGSSEDMPSALGDFISSPATLIGPMSPEPRQPKLEDIKVEVPEMSNQPTTTPKTVRFSDVIQELRFETTNSPIPSDIGSEFFPDEFKEAYISVNQKAEQENLSSEDITARVDIPELEFENPDAPWKRFEGVQSQAGMSTLQRSFILDTVASGLSHWPGSRQKESKLPWMPVPANLAQLCLEDDASVDDKTWQLFVEDDGDIIDSSSLTWKPAGLRILSDEDDEEEIDYGLFRKDTPPDLSAIVKKRKLEMQERENSRHSTLITGAVSKTASTSLSKRTAKSAPTAAAASGDFGLLGGVFSAQASLDNYLELRGMKRARLAESSYFATSVETQPTKEIPRNDASKLPGLPIRRSPAHKQKLPEPSIKPLAAPTWVIVSTTVLKNRALIKLIEAQLPSVTLIERDFTAHNTSAWMPGSVARSPVKSSLDAEADFIISPSVGIVITTLQQMKQKPLPGAKTKPAIRERLENVSLRYEKLILLISEGNVDNIGVGLAESDCLAFAEFAGFVSGLEALISMQFVGGGDEMLSKWIASSVIQYRVDTMLLADETHWEVFLRRAGLNAFAAQEVIARVKAPDGIDPHNSIKAGIFGLTSFVEMGGEERLARFGQVCGQKVLTRVSAVIDARWE